MDELGKKVSPRALAAYPLHLNHLDDIGCHRDPASGEVLPQRECLF